MKIAIVGPPFIAVPPPRYGGTELFIANLACGLHARGHDVTVYANGESRLPCRTKWRYPVTGWPIRDPLRAELKNIDHTAWAICDAADSADVIHLNDIVGVPFTRMVDAPVVLTLHHTHEPALSEQYMRYPRIVYVAIAAWLRRREPMPRLHSVHHGIPMRNYRFARTKDDYVAFLGRMVPCKGAHGAIEAARRAGVRLKLAGEVQPLFREYWETRVAPHIDGRRVEYIGEVNPAEKNQLLSRARALLFPIEWEEPFGLVMIEAMACGTPVLAFPGGAVEEIVRNGVNGWVCRDATEMAARLRAPLPASASCREFAERHFSLNRMVDRYVAIYEQSVAGAEARRATENWSSDGRRDPVSGPVLHSGDRLESDGASRGPSA
jgi:glycosyltransferase involved in cell wall biosynthesis